MPDVFQEFVRETIDKMLKKLTPEERLKGLTPEERLKGLSAAEVLAALPPQTREALVRHLKANGSSAQPS